MKKFFLLKEQSAFNSNVTPVTISWKGLGKKVYIIGNFPNNQHRIELRQNKNSVFKDKEITLFLPPGKYKYKFEVDGLSKIDNYKEKEEIGGVEYNIINILPEDLVINYTNRSMRVSNKKVNRNKNKLFKNKMLPHIANEDIEKYNKEKEISLSESNGFFNYSNNFSIKDENYIQDSRNASNVDISSVNNKIVVYKLKNEFLVHMIIITRNLGDSFIINAKYANDEEEKEYVLLKKTDVFYQEIDSFEPIGDLSLIKYPNELSFLSYIQSRLKLNKPFIYIGDIMLLINNDNNKDNKECNFFIDEFLQEDTTNILYIYKNLCNVNEVNFNSNINIIVKFIYAANKHFNYINISKLIENIISIMNIEMKYIIHFSFNQKNNIFNFIPIFSTCVDNNEMYKENVLFTKRKFLFLYSENSNRNFLNHYIYKIVQKAMTREKNKDIYILWERISKVNIQVINYVNKLYFLFNQLEIKNKVINVIKLIMLSFCAFEYKNMIKMKELTLFKEEISLKNINKKNMIFYSNIAILLMVKYINNIINSTIHKIKNQKSKKEVNYNLIVLFNSMCKEDEIILSEVIKNRTETYLNETFSSHDNNNNNNNKSFNSLSSFIHSCNNDTIIQYEKSLNSNEKNLIKKIEYLVNLSFLDSQNNPSVSTIIKSYKSYINYAIDILEKSDNKNTKIKHIWNLNYYGNYFNFISIRNNITKLFQTNLIIEYVKLYNHYNEKKKYFRSFTMERLFKIFLPILSDIDTKYSPDKHAIYIQKLNTYIKELHSFQNIKEIYFIDNQRVSIGYQTFEILYLLLKALYEDNTIKIQHAQLRRVHKNSIVKKLAQYAKKIQFAFRYYLLNKYKNKSINELGDLIFNKYKSSSPQLLLFIINSNKYIDDLNKENMLLKGKLGKNRIGHRECFTEKKIKKPIQLKNVINDNNNSNNSNKDFLKSMRSLSFRNSTSKKVKNTIPHKKNKDIKELKEKIKEAKKNYIELLIEINSYEKKMKDFYFLIGKNKEVKDMLLKNGIQINY